MNRLVTLLCVLIIGTFAFADGTGSADIDGTSGNATTEVTLDLSPSTGDSNVIIGFTTDVLTDAFDIDSDMPNAARAFPMTLTEDGKVKMSDQLFVFWQIASGSPLDITLSAGAPMSNGSGGNLDWKTEWTSKVESTDSGVRTSTGKSSATDSGEYNLDASVYDRDKALTYGDAGYAELTIVTDDIMEKAPGTYTGTLTLKVTSDGV